MMERIGVVDELIASAVRATAMEFHADGVTIGRLQLDTVDSPFAFSLSTAQTETERILTERLAARGITVDRGVELVGLEQDDDEVRSTLRHTDGSEETLGPRRVTAFAAQWPAVNASNTGVLCQPVP